MKELKVGMIGSGYMGKGFALALSSIPTVFNIPIKLTLELIATSNSDGAARAATALGFNRSTGNWSDVVSDPNVDVIISCTPNYMHKEIALAAMLVGKHIFSEKPMGLDVADARIMSAAAERAGVKTMVGYCYMKNPAVELTREIIQRGEIGDIIHFRGTHIEDYLADEREAVDWRVYQNKAGPGALGDLCHIINMAEYLCGDISKVVSDTQIVYSKRPNKNGEPQTVENEDQAHFLCRFEKSGALGYLECSRVATGRKMGLTYEITGTQGSIVFDQSRLSELKLYTNNDCSGREGFRTILLGPEHSDYGSFCAGAGHGLGYNDLLTIELRDFIVSILEDKPVWPSFKEGYTSARVVDAVLRSASEGSWVTVDKA